MPLKVYNSLTRQKQIFETLVPGKVGMYVCGPTVYDYCHIGHARSVVVFDVIYRYLMEKGYEVTYVRNFTDIDDKLIDRAASLGMTTRDLAERFIASFYEDMNRLNVLPATVEPRATDHIEDIIRVVSLLIERGHAYRVDDEVFFSVDSFSDYGKLSGRRLEEMEAGIRVKVDSRKKNPFDFVLWKSAKPGEPFWESPWGRGRPGWHIECTAMSSHFLGESFDIHGGGMDLSFPHHENEIAQSEAAFGKRFVSFWIHNGFVNINQEKMSKSLGNFLLIKDVLKTHHPETVRLFLLSKHYRKPIDFTQQALVEAGKGLDRIYALLKRLDEMKYNEQAADEPDPRVLERFIDFMDDDFNTAGAIGVIFDTVHELNRMLDSETGIKKGSKREKIIRTRSSLVRMLKVLGLCEADPGKYFEETERQEMVDLNIDIKLIEDLVKERYEARQERDWKKADEIRDKLAGMNVVLEDRADKTVWKIKKR